MISMPAKPAQKPTACGAPNGVGVAETWDGKKDTPGRIGGDVPGGEAGCRPTVRKQVLTVPTRQPPSCRGHNKGENANAIRGDLCVCCNCGCPSHRHLARTCVGQSQWQGSALDGHVDGAEPDRIDRIFETVKRGRMNRRTGRARSSSPPLRQRGSVGQRVSESAG